MSDPKQDKPLPPESLIPDASDLPKARKLKEYQELVTYKGNDTGRFYHDVMRRLRIFNS